MNIRSWNALNQWADERRIRQHEDKVLLVLTLLIGAAVGLVIVAFIILTENLGARMYPAGGAPWRRLVVPVLGALITGYLLQRYFPNARGSGIPQTKTAMFMHGGVIRFRTVLGKFGLSSVSLASGISLGREGPSVQVGAGIASTLGRQLGLSPSTIKALVPIGSAAALAAAFNTPIAAVLFTLEEVRGNLHARVLGAIVLSSATSWIVLHLMLGDEPLFHVPAYQLVNPMEFGIYAVLGVIGGIVSVCFVKLLLWQRKYFLRMPSWTQWFQPVAGGLTVGILGWFVPNVLGVGYGHVSQALNGQLALGTMAILVALKLVATATCYASGNAGGIFGPSLFIGAMMGGALGGGAHMLFPDYTGSVGAYALVGMGTAFAGIVRVPMTSVIMIFEITRDYSVIVPLMIANLISYFISSRMQKVPIYEALMHQDGIHLPAGARDREELLSVREALHAPKQVLNAADNVEHALAGVSAMETAWPVIANGEFLGMVTRSRLEGALKQGKGLAGLSEFFTPSDHASKVTSEAYPHVHPDHPLETAIRRMAQTGVSVVPVVSREDSRNLLGVVSLNDALAAYRSVKEKPEAEVPPHAAKTPLGLLGGVIVVLMVMISLGGFLAYYYRSQRTVRARNFFAQGTELMAQDRYQEATEKFRSALSISHSSQDRLALATALLKGGRPQEAGVYFDELAKADPNSGPANLGLARIAMQEGDFEGAIEHYHHAIYGAWPSNAAIHRVQVRTELVENLAKSGRKTQAQAELLALMSEMPDDLAVKKQVAQLLLDYGLPRESAEVFQAITKQAPGEASAYAGLGEAQYEQDNYRAAEDAFRNAVRLNPADEKSKDRLQVTEHILVLDPNLKGLLTSERYQRSLKLMTEVLGSLDECAATLKGSPPKNVTQAADAARKVLMSRRRPQSYGDALETNLSLIEQLWKLRLEMCGPPATAELVRLMPRLTK